MEFRVKGGDYTMQDNYMNPTTHNYVEKILTSYLDIKEKPKIKDVSAEELLESAWSITGKHMRNSLNYYGKQIEEKQAKEKAESVAGGR